MNTYFATNVLLVALIPIWGPPLPMDEHAVVSVSCNLPPQAVIGAPLTLECVFRNASASPVRLDLGWNRLGNFAFVMNPGTRSATTRVQPSMGLWGGISRSQFVRIAANGTHVQRVLLNEWLDLSRPGTHRLEVSFEGRIQVEGQFVALQHHDALVVSLRLGSLYERQEIAGSLFERAKRTRSSEERLEVVQALAFMNDPAAIPHLYKLAMYNISAGIAISGLERMGGDAAIAALESLQKHPNGGVAMGAGAALRRLKARQE